MILVVSLFLTSIVILLLLHKLLVRVSTTSRDNSWGTSRLENGQINIITVTAKAVIEKASVILSVLAIVKE